MLTLIGGVSEFFSDQLAVHVVKGQRQRVESGLHQGRPPFGYRVDEPGAAACIHEQEGPAVRTSFAMRAAGQSNGEIADWLNGQGFRTLTGRLHTAHSVKDMLNRKFYVGVVSYRGEEFRGQHEPLIDETTFALVQGRRTPRGPHHRTADAPRPLLAGMPGAHAVAARSMPTGTRRVHRCIGSATAGRAARTVAPSWHRRWIVRWGLSSERSACARTGAIVS